jgi:hypothetical protein
VDGQTALVTYLVSGVKANESSVVQLKLVWLALGLVEQLQGQQVESRYKREDERGGCETWYIDEKGARAAVCASGELLAVTATGGAFRDFFTLAMDGF